jgi:hypothetical protein
MVFRRLLAAVLIVVALAAAYGCDNDAMVASRNLSQAADMFEINRRVVFYNGITGEWILSVEGRCSMTADRSDNQLELTVKTGPNEYKKHFLGLSDNVTYFAEQLDAAGVDVYHYRIIFKPATIIPGIDARL